MPPPSTIAAYLHNFAHLPQTIYQLRARLRIIATKIFFQLLQAQIRRYDYPPHFVIPPVYHLEKFFQLPRRLIARA